MGACVCLCRRMSMKVRACICECEWVRVCGSTFVPVSVHVAVRTWIRVWRVCGVACVVLV